MDETEKTKTIQGDSPSESAALPTDPSAAASTNVQDSVKVEDAPEAQPMEVMDSAKSDDNTTIHDPVQESITSPEESKSTSHNEDMMDVVIEESVEHAENLETSEPELVSKQLEEESNDQQHEMIAPSAIIDSAPTADSDLIETTEGRITEVSEVLIDDIPLQEAKKEGDGGDNPMMESMTRSISNETLPEKNNDEDNNDENNEDNNEDKRQMDDNESIEPEQEQEADNEADADNEAKDSESNEDHKKTVKKPRKRASILKSLGVTEGSVEDANENDSQPRISARAAAALAKTRLSNKPGASLVTTNEEENAKKNDGVTKKSAKKIKGTQVTNTETEAPEEPAPEACWACCDTCEKWRKLPSFIKESTLPDKWYCHMNEWDPKHNTCDAPQEVDGTTNENAPSHDDIPDEPIPVQSSDNGSVVKAPRSTMKGKKPPKTPQTIDSNKEIKEPRHSIVPTAHISPKNIDQEASLRQAPKRKSTQPINTTPTTKSNQTTNADAVNWVQCNRCTKWRKVPTAIPINSLPETWYCELNTWNPSYARCSAKQEPDTTTPSVTATQQGNVSSGLTRSISLNSVTSRGSAASNPNQPKNNNSTTGEPKMTTQWVCCERKNCEKWRKIPLTMELSDLPEKWYCEMNTWDLERAYCDAPEETDNENGGDPSVATRSQLILANSKGPGTLSYRRIIFGTDGKIRPIYSEKSKSGHGLFSFAERFAPINRSSDVIDNDSPEDPTKRVSYWHSSVYDDAGINYSSSNKGRNSGSTNTNSNTSSKAQQQLDEIKKKYVQGPVDSILSHLSKSIIPTKSDSSKYHINTNDNTSNNVDTLDPMNHQSLASPVIPYLSEPALFPLSNTWPKKSTKVCDIVDNATFFEKRELCLSLIRSCFLTNEDLSLSITTLYELIKSSHFMNELLNYYRNFVTFESLKMTLRFMEDIGEVYVTTDSQGISTIHYSRFILNSNGTGSFTAPNRSTTLLPPKLRGKKSKLLADLMDTE